MTNQSTRRRTRHSSLLYSVTFTEDALLDMRKAIRIAYEAELVRPDRVVLN